jgi:hypothetical protein
MPYGQNIKCRSWHLFKRIAEVYGQVYNSITWIEVAK